MEGTWRKLDAGTLSGEGGEREREREREREGRLTRTRGIWILLTPFINQASAHLDQIYALSGTLVIGDGPVAARLGVTCDCVCAMVHPILCV